MALLNRILKSNRFGGIGLLKNQNGEYSKNVKESLDLLLKTHFPESVPLQAIDNPSGDLGNFPINDNITITQQKNISARIKASFCSESDLKRSIINEQTSIPYALPSCSKSIPCGAREKCSSFLILSFN